ncbi:monoheme cytochrome C [Flagellimonas meishanensis]|uniref:monoheme cytochrome C n=1 Tax=Flagellimonas meishanensis TaxID=2873264 RepID=UPI001CA73BC7|nr:monoheme cytochrome C [[Muricauda] meishanensis]
MDPTEKFKKNARAVYSMMLSIFAVFAVLGAFLVYLTIDPTFSAFKSPKAMEEYTSVSETDDYDKIENGIHVRTGFVEGEGLMLVVNNCTNCHSAKLVTQNRMSKEGWEATIRWMQETQNLWDLGNNQEPIVNYLATYYAPTQKGRRQNLTAIEWYVLED